MKTFRFGFTSRSLQPAAYETEIMPWLLNKLVVLGKSLVMGCAHMLCTSHISDQKVFIKY